MKLDSFGKELLLDLHECDVKLFDRKSIRNYFVDVCELIAMERCKLTWWDDLHTPEGEKETEPHMVGTSAVQFIKTSNITIHTLDLMDRVYLNIFSCKDFDEKIAAQFSAEWFHGKIVSASVVARI